MILVIAAVSSAAAQTPPCGEPYEIKPGQTLSGIAQEAYKDASKWSLIFYGNQEKFGGEPSTITPGTKIRIPCLVPDAEFVPYEPATTGDIELLTAGDYKPFTDQSLRAGGLITEIVQSAFEVAGADATHKITWINDWSAHLDPLLVNRSFDMGFPWLQPDCDNFRALSEGGKFRCENFLFSDPLFEMLVMLYVSSTDPVLFDVDSDLEGKRICRPAGYYTFDLDAPERRWLSEDKITLVQPRTVADCFEMLVDGEVDGVTVNNFTGRQQIEDLNISDRVFERERAISIQTLHVLVPKTHPRATVMLYRFNQGLRALKTEDGYDEILDAHLSAFWAQFN
jgi:polar amino acid transport system substrate-binding protein